MLKLTHISKTFNPGTVNAKKAIEDLSFHAAKGDEGLRDMREFKHGCAPFRNGASDTEAVF